MSQSTQPFQAKESSTAKLTGIIEDEDGTGIPAASLSSLTLSLYDQATELATPGSTSAIINSRNRQSILNTNGCTVDSTGGFVLTLSTADNAIVNSTKDTERHVALIEWTYAAGLKAGKEAVLVDVSNLARTT